MTTKLRAVLYARISLDKSGEGAGVERQMESLRKTAKTHGWRIVEEVIDNDISAWSGKRKRPGYERVMALIAAGEVDVVAVWHMSRLWRARRERVIGMELLQEHRVNLVTAQGPSFDFSTATGRMLANLVSEIDEYESSIKSERVTAATAQRVSKGYPSGGLGYGWRRKEDGTYVIEQREAKIVREVVRRVIAGDTIRGITADLNAREIAPPGADLVKEKHSWTNPDGDRWGTSSVRKLALRASNCGDLVHQGRVIGKGVWTPLISEEDHARAHAAIGAKKAKAGNPGGSNGTRKHLLSRTVVAVCGVCGGPLRQQTKRGREATHADLRLYVCETTGCVGRSQEHVDAMVTAVMLARLARKDIAQLIAAENSAPVGDLVELETLETRLADYEELAAAGKITPTAFAKVAGKLEPRIAELRNTVNVALVTDSPLADLAGGRSPEEVWAAWTPGQRVAAMEVLRLRVRILPREKSGKGFEPESVEIGWEA
jgi:site-specific DNA recombinase